MPHLKYLTRSGIEVGRTTSKIPFRHGLHGMLRELDRHRGVYLSSGYEYPGRYSRWDIASVCPPLELIGSGRTIRFRALNERGAILNRLLQPVLTRYEGWETFDGNEQEMTGILKQPPKWFPEEERSKQPSALAVLRSLIEEFRTDKDQRLTFIGAFGYDLLFQFDPIELKLPRNGAKDIHLFLCDDIVYMDRKREVIERFTYEFTQGDLTTRGVERKAEEVSPPPPARQSAAAIVSDHTPEEYMANVETVREGMRRGDYYEVVLRQTFSTEIDTPPSELFERIQQASPSPYEFLLQLGEEQLIGASPEIFVRVEGSRVETCPISGTARRTGDPMKDAASIRELLNSAKEESELTMCTDVDRNDKSRVCVPGSVRVIGRRLIESYAGLFHTVDHVEGTLQPGFDALDAFLAHMWSVTMIGAPKRAAARAIESLEKSARGWYGGAVGVVSLSGDVNTGILIRTVHLKGNRAEYPVGATLLYDSIPEAEEQETRLKATGFVRALAAARGMPLEGESPVPRQRAPTGPRPRLLLVDNEDCFIHTLANYARQTGADVITYRAGFPLELLDRIEPSLILISPGPGRPSEFGVPDLVRHAASRRIPVFGVCLGLQGVVEAFGGELGVLDYPMHGKPSEILHWNRGVFEDLPNPMQVGRYHSLYAVRDKLPAGLEITAETPDGVIMGVRHRELPIEAVQFHPESLLTLNDDAGLRLIEAVVERYGRVREAVVANS
jgi:anthranilate synthase